MAEGLAAEEVLRPEGPGVDDFLMTLGFQFFLSSALVMTLGLTGGGPEEEGNFLAGVRLSLARSGCCGGDTLYQ